MKPGSFLLTTLVLLSIMVSGQDVAPDAAIQSTSQQANSDQSTSFEDATLQMAHSQTIGSEDATYHFQPSGAGYTAANSAHNLGINVDKSAVTISLTGETWQLASNTYTKSFTLDENRLTIHRSGFDEWYVNGPVGLQQGFTLYEPSDISFEVSGSLVTMLEDQSLKMGDVLTFSGLIAYDAAGQLVPVKFALDNDKLAYVYDDSNAIYPLTIDPWVQQATLTASDRDAFDRFGAAVAISGNTAIIGAEGNGCAGGDNCGSAYIFVRSGNSWSQQAKLIANDAAANDYFGVSVAIDGNTAVIGADEDDCAAGLNCGSAYVFVRSGSAWSQQAKLIAGDAAPDDYFGWTVAVDSDTAMVGAIQNDCAKGSDCGNAYVFVRSGSTWSQQAKLSPNDKQANAYFGISVSLDGNTALIGASGQDCSTPQGCGAYVFTRSGGVWSQQAKLIGTGVVTGDYFGHSVSLSANTALIGNYLDDCGAGNNCGSAYVFVRSGGIWSQQAKLTASDKMANDYFGASVSISGNLAFIGAYGTNCTGGDYCGSAYIFGRVGTTWYQQAELNHPGPAPLDWYALSLAVDGFTSIVGAYGDDCSAGTACGSAFVYVLNSVPLNASAVCDAGALVVTITSGDGPFNITASAGINMPVIGVPQGITSIKGPEKWDDVTVVETGGDVQAVNLGQFKCRTDARPVPVSPAHRAHTTNPYPPFSWTGITDANNYRLFVFDDANVATRTVDIRQNSGGPTSMTLSTPLPTMRLFWRVRGRQNRLWSLWSVRFTLFVDPVVAAPGVADTAPVPSGTDGSSPPNNRDGMTPAPTIAAPPPTQLPPPPNSR